MARIAFLMDLPRNSGAGRYAIELQKRITKPLEIDYLYFDYEQRALILDGEVERRTLAKTYSPLLGDNKVWFWLRLKKHIPEYDLYHFITPNLSFLVANGKKSLVTCHDIAPLFIPTSFWEKRWRRYLYSGLKRADALIADSASTRRDLCRAYGLSEEKIPVIPLGVDRSIYHPLDRETCRKVLRLPSERKIVLNVALESWRKNIPGLIRATAVLKETYPDILLIRVGKANNNTLELIKSLDLTDNIRYVNANSEEDLVRLYNAADVFAFPSFYEGFGLPVLEAMACGTPVVASNRTSIPEIVGDTGILVDPEDISALTKGIEQVLNEAPLAKDLSHRGIERAGEFTWENTAKSTSSVYATILNYVQPSS
jgi:glycosyltransferase involved in cell wall biosynthesis